MGDWIDRLARRAATGDVSRRQVLGEMTPALDRLDRAAARAAMAGNGRITRRQGLKGLAAGALLAGPVGASLTGLARGASCVSVDDACVQASRATFSSAVGRCGTLRTGTRDIWAELRCRLQARRELELAQAGCRKTDDSACPPGQSCDPQTGRCTTAPPAGGPAEPPRRSTALLCGDDFPTDASLQAAADAAASGQSDVAVSPGGCVRHVRTVESGALTYEAMTLAGRTVLEFTYDDTGTSGRQDRDLDGFFEWDFTLSRGTDREETVIRELDPQSAAVRRRERRTARGSNIHVIVEEDTGSGLQTTEEFDTPRDQDEHRRGVRARAAEPGPCDPARELKYGGWKFSCIQQLAQCLEKKGRGDIGRELMETGIRTIILCDDLEGRAYAMASDAHEAGGVRFPRIVMDPAALEADKPEDQQRQTMCHELLHYTSLGLHGEGAANNDLTEMTDPVYACVQMCTSAATKCECATCLGTTACDQRCAEFFDCSVNEEYICPCPDCAKSFATDEQCRAECPTCSGQQGLDCFGFSTCIKAKWKC